MVPVCLIIMKREFITSENREYPYADCNDRGSDFSPAQLEGLDIHFVPMRLTLDGKTYSSGEDLSAEEFYDLLEKTESFPTTSQPSAGEFAQIYRQLAQKDPEILSIHISSGLSGTMDSARAGADNGARSEGYLLGYENALLP